MNSRRAELPPTCERCGKPAKPAIMVACRIAYASFGGTSYRGGIYRCQYCWGRPDVPVVQQLSYLEDR